MLTCNCRNCAFKDASVRIVFLLSAISDLIIYNVSVYMKLSGPMALCSLSFHGSLKLAMGKVPKLRQKNGKCSASCNEIVILCMTCPEAAVHHDKAGSR